MPNAREDQFLGALLGLAIGDALGMPVRGQSAATIAASGPVAHYRAGIRPDGAAVVAGEFTDETEIALCIVEAATANGGVLDLDTIGPRLGFLAASESRHWMSELTAAALERAAVTLTFQVPINEDDPATGDVASRGVPVGLLHAIGPEDRTALAADAAAVARLTHGSPAASTAVEAVALAVRLAARAEETPEAWPGLIADRLGGGELADRLRRLEPLLQADPSPADALAVIGNGQAAIEAVPAAFWHAISAHDFPGAVLAAVNAGGATDTIGAIAGAIAGARFGVAGIPQPLIDDLEGRIYLSLAAPWLFRAVLLRSGEIIDLRRRQPPRPDMPPRF